MATVMIGTFMAVLDATIVNVALNKIMASFGIRLKGRMGPDRVYAGHGGD